MSSCCSSYEGANLNDVPAEKAIKHEMDIQTGRWSKREVMVRLASKAFQEGTMRYVYHLKDLSMPAGQQDCVAKLSKHPNEDRQTYFTEVEMQVQCKQLAHAFNRANPPKKIDFLVPCVMEFPRRKAPNGLDTLLLGVEPSLKGRYVKYSNNYGFVSPEERNTPQAFSHFTWCASRGRLLVCDIQGVDDTYTDPQIHSNEGPGIFKYGKGDMGIDGIRKFFATHRCNPICEFFGLVPERAQPPQPTEAREASQRAPRARRMSLDEQHAPIVRKVIKTEGPSSAYGAPAVSKWGSTSQPARRLSIHRIH